ncbi:hypothetical protein BC940DRAFT_296977 [Gongronella butleri]|nr:hypothetical protein BC940DRAFT_296977 [Gongronella butleri]
MTQPTENNDEPQLSLESVIQQYGDNAELLELILSSKVEEDRRRTEEARLRSKELDLYMRRASTTAAETAASSSMTIESPLSPSFPPIALKNPPVASSSSSSHLPKTTKLPSIGAAYDSPVPTTAPRPPPPSAHPHPHPPRSPAANSSASPLLVPPPPPPMASTSPLPSLPPIHTLTSRFDSIPEPSTSTPLTPWPYSPAHHRQSSTTNSQNPRHAAQIDYPLPPQEPLSRRYSTPDGARPEDEAESDHTHRRAGGRMMDDNNNNNRSNSSHTGGMDRVNNKLPLQPTRAPVPATKRRRREMQSISMIIETKEFPYEDGYHWKNNGNTVHKKTGQRSIYYKCSNGAKGCPVNKTVTFKDNDEYLIKYRGKHLDDCASPSSSS